MRCKTPPPADLRQLCRVFAVAIAIGLFGCAASPPEAFPSAEPPPASDEATAPPLVVRPDYPQQYVVAPGDTLWDIASRFLRDPWRWPEVWQTNPQVANPHLIYPGDVLVLHYVDGKPVIQVQQERGGGRPTIKLSPQVRIEDLERPVPTIPMEAIRQFLTRARVMSEDEYDTAPYIVSSADEHLMTGLGNRVYVRGVRSAETLDYVVVRAGKMYRDPDDPDEILGYEGLYVADARLVGYGDPATLRLTASGREALNGDRLFPAAYDQISRDFVPRAPNDELKGRIISVVDGVTQIGQYQVVVLNLGRQEGVETGYVLAVYREGDRVRDRIIGKEIKLPNERAGLVMVFRVFDRVSYALVMNATRAIHVMDSVKNP